MPVATPEIYNSMLDTAQANDYAYPAINCTSSETINAALKGFADAKSDGIIQFSTGAGEFASGLNVKDMAFGTIALAEFTHRVASKYNIYVALHTDHCVPGKVEKFLHPLITATARRRSVGQGNLFQSHMFDGSELPLPKNMATSVELMKLCKANEIILEVETGVVGGEEDGIDNTGASHEKLYTTPNDMVEVYKALSSIGGRYMLAATFGNVHGIYKPGNVVLKPKILKEGQDEVVRQFGRKAYFDLVFHGGSGSELSDIHETLGYGVIKMNVDTDAQYYFTEAVVAHVDANRKVLTHTAEEMADKKKFDPRTYLKKAEENMAKRVSMACNDLRSTGNTLYTP
ncbi:MAG: class II fructose-bisphosphate aldolase [candidate division Zixibacteria bacterium]|nr:class II fructose-bisphosphate aldolase [candidate division Zixibacteria bacterium]